MSKEGDSIPPRMTIDASSLSNAPGVRSIFKALNGEARFVGGCVRDILLGQKPGDIDITTPWQPESVMKRLQAAGLSVHPIGIDHGTVLAVTEDKLGQYEITTLRKDVETDGRHAVVAFTQSYREDALRRDLTFNAMSLDQAGNLYDYFQGIDDLEAGHVRFVGDATSRIQEDRLRILRYFRFYARYGATPPDAETRDALISEVHGIDALSGERLNQELSRMLVGPRPTMIIQMMLEYGLLEPLIGLPIDLEGLRRLVGVEGALQLADVQRRFAVLLGRSRQRIDLLADKFRWPNRDRQRMRLMADGALPPLELGPMIYRFGSRAAQDWLILSAANLNQPVNPELWQMAQDWRPPTFPITGQHILDAGYAPGPTIGEIRLKLEEWWISHDFKPSLEELLAYLDQLKG